MPSPKDKKCPKCNVLIARSSRHCRKHRVYTDEHRKKLSDSNKLAHQGKVLSEKHKKAIGRALRGEKHGMWKGDDVSYINLHSWVRRELGRPETCSNCGIKGGKRGGKWTIEWANKDHKYKRALDDFVSLCTSCHRKYDIENNNYEVAANN